MPFLGKSKSLMNWKRWGGRPFFGHCLLTAISFVLLSLCWMQSAAPSQALFAFSPSHGLVKPSQSLQIQVCPRAAASSACTAFSSPAFPEFVLNTLHRSARKTPYGEGEPMLVGYALGNLERIRDGRRTGVSSRVSGVINPLGRKGTAYYLWATVASNPHTWIWCGSSIHPFACAHTPLTY